MKSISHITNDKKILPDVEDMSCYKIEFKEFYQYDELHG